MSEKKEKKLTPVGEAKWAHVHTPKAAFKDEKGFVKGEPKFQIDVIFSPDDPDWKLWAKDVMDKIKALPDQKDKDGDKIKKQLPIKRELDETEKPTGKFYVTFKTGSTFKPGVFDRFGKPIPENILIGNGSQVRVSYTENTYEPFGGGINFYLNAIQVLELIEYKAKNAEAYGFPVETEPVNMPTDGDIPF